MATEQLIVELDAKTAKLDAKLQETERRLDQLDGTVKKSDISLRQMAGGAIKLGAAALALSSAITAMVVASAKGRRELELLAKQAKTSTSDFQALSFATSQYGINAEQIADISKDIADKIGEFSSAGTGVFQDYADVMKLTKEEAAAAAKEFEGLSSQEILGTMVSRMEDASVSGDKMTFVLESMGNDASKLIPLFAKNSEELNRLKDRFNTVNDSLQITSNQAKGLQSVNESFDLMTKSMGNATTAISATLAPVINDFFNDIIDIVPDATQTIINFINSFLDAENITSSAGARQQIKETEDLIKVLQERVRIEEETTKNKMAQNQFSGITLVTSNAALENEKRKLEEYKAQLEVLVEQERLADAARLKGGEIGGESGAEINDLTSIKQDEEIKAIEDRFKLEETLLAEKLARELELIGDNKRLIRDLEDEFFDNTLKLEKKREKEREKELKREEREEKGRYEFKLDQASGFVNAASILNSALGNDNEILAAGLIVADTAAAVMKSLSINPYDYANVAVLIATGIAQLSSIGSSTPSSSGGGGAPASAPVQQQESFNPDQSQIGLDFQSESSSSQNIIRFDTDSGDQLIDVLAGLLNESMRQGRS